MCKKVISSIRKAYGDASLNDASDIQKAAELLLTELHSANQRVYPVPVVSLLSEMGFDLFRTFFKNHNQSGLVAVDSSLPEKNKAFRTNRIVLVNRKDSPAQQRFAIAHEIAHYIFDYDEAALATYYKAYLTTEKNDAIELRANRFAAELLMPTNDFKARFNVYKADQKADFSLPDVITSLSQYFDVPAAAVQRRLEETGCVDQSKGA